MNDTRRAWRLLLLGCVAWLATWLAACAVLPGSLTISEAELQAQLAKRFPVQRSLLEMVDLELSDPRIRLDAPTNRLATELTLRGAERRGGRVLQGRLTLDYGLRYEPADASIRLVQPRVQSLQFDDAAGLTSRRAESMQRLAAGLAERVLDDLVLYRVPPERIERMRRLNRQPGELRVTPDGLEITLVPFAAP
jgi:hypothetical protein